MSVWVVVADSSRARVFDAQAPKGAIREIETLVHTQSRLHEQNLTQDLPGRTFDRGGQGRHAMEDRSSPKVHEREVFAREISAFLEQGRNKHRFEKLILVAGAPFLGSIRSHLSKQTSGVVERCIEKDLSRKTAADIRNLLPEKLWMVHPG